MSSVTAKTTDNPGIPSKRPDGAKIPRIRREPKREATVYDAVAGRVSSIGFIPLAPFPSIHRERPSSTTVSVPPEEVLFRRRNAPARVAESDIYFASDQLPPGALPDSDLLKAVHAYSSEFYARATETQGLGDWRSMDETALLAVGILLEEASRAAVGGTGDLALVEEEELDSARGVGATARSVLATTAGQTRSGKTRRGRKRRRIEKRAKRESENKGGSD